jgi:hypothetical protein
MKSGSLFVPSGVRLIPSGGLNDLSRSTEKFEQSFLDIMDITAWSGGANNRYEPGPDTSSMYQFENLGQRAAYQGSRETIYAGCLWM